MQAHKNRAPKINNTKLPSAFILNKQVEDNNQIQNKIEELVEIQQYKQNQQLLEPIDTRQKHEKNKKEKKNPLSPLKNYMKQFKKIENDMQDLPIQYNVQNIINQQNFSQKLLLEEMITLNHLKKSRGNSGSVKKMLHVPSISVYACKEEPLLNKESRIILKDWIQIFQNNPHQNLLQIYSLFWNTPEGYVSIITELANMSLQDLLESVASLPENLIQIIAYCVMNGLKHLHSLNQYHGYLVPTQVLLSSDGIKLGIGISIRNNLQQEKSKTLIENQGNSLFDKNNCNNLLKLTQNETSIQQQQSIDVFKFGLLILQCAVGNFDILDFNQEDIDNFRQKIGKNNQSCCILHSDLSQPEKTASFNSKVTLKQLFQFLNFSKQLESFLCQCLQYDNTKRPSIQQLLNHQFFAVNYKDILNLKDLMHISQNWSQLPKQYQAASENQLERIQEAIQIVIQNCKKENLFISNVQNLNEDSQAVKELAQDLGLKNKKLFQTLANIAQNI